MNHFISCDWGTTSFRLRIIDWGTAEVIEEMTSANGISKVHQDWIANGSDEPNRISFYKNYLALAINELKQKPKPGIPIIISGMASSSIGILELPYKEIPFVLGSDMPDFKVLEPTTQVPFPVYIISGFRTSSDVMRGEETMLLGVDNFSEDEVCILPGTHSKHAFIKSGLMVDFKTYITGELFSVMCRFSILSNSVKEGESIEVFEAGVEAAQSGNLLNQFFRVRTRHLLDKTPQVENYQFLSGLLIGTELNELKGRGSKIRLISDGAVASLYIRAFEKLRLKLSLTSATEALVKGHLRIFEMLNR